MQSLYNRLQSSGWRVTAQRRVVAQAFEGVNLHLTADQVLERARAGLPEISRATVYNTLRDLVEMNELVEVVVPDGPKRYDPNPEHHHHVFCVQCGAIQDVHVEGESELSIREPEPLGCDILDVRIIFHARCQGCQGSE